MKKEYFAIFLLAAMLAASIINTDYLHDVTAELTSFIKETADHAAENDWESAETSFEKAMSRWNAIKGYTHIVIKHDKIDAVIEAFYDLLGAIREKDAVGAAVGCKKLNAIIEGIYSMEKIRAGSIF